MLFFVLLVHSIILEKLNKDVKSYRHMPIDCQSMTGSHLSVKLTISTPLTVIYI